LALVTAVQAFRQLPDGCQVGLDILSITSQQSRIELQFAPQITSQTQFPPGVKLFSVISIILLFLLLLIFR
jgi:hypothetical protein